jgi:hypothetical protein
VQGIGRLVNASSDLLLDKLDDLVVLSRQDGNVSELPRDVFDDRQNDWIEILRLEAPFLYLFPGGCILLKLDELVD